MNVDGGDEGGGGGLLTGTQERMEGKQKLEIKMGTKRIKSKMTCPTEPPVKLYNNVEIIYGGMVKAK